MSLTLKLASLAIRTLAKPVGNSIKSRAREHGAFRTRCVAFAQGLHRVDMRMRLGILHDAAAQERMYAREAAEAAAKKKQADTPTVLTEAEQKKADAETTEEKEKKAKEKPKPPTIRPLSETKAIELGANFIAESFIFMVAAGLLVFERWWSRRKESKKDEGMVDRIQELECRLESISYLEDEMKRLRETIQSDQPGKGVPGDTEDSMGEKDKSLRTKKDDTLSLRKDSKDANTVRSEKPTLRAR